MLKNPLALALIIILTCCPGALAQNREPDISTRIQLALIDYESVHASLFERCTQSFPESASLLHEAITDWQTKNREPLRNVRLIFRDNLARGQGSTSTVDAQIATMSKVMTTDLKEQLSKVSLTELEKACTGGFATTLQSQDLNFEELLNRIRPAQSMKSVDAQTQRSNTTTALAVSAREGATQSEQGLYANVKEPTTTKELLENIKFVQEHALLLREDFYRDDNIKQFFGAERLRWYENNQNIRKYASSDFRFKDSHGTVWVTWSNRSTNGRPSPDGTTHAGLDVAMNYDESGVTLETVKEVFGSGGKVTQNWVSYDLNTLGTQQNHVGFRFDTDGTVKHIQFLTSGSH